MSTQPLTHDTPHKEGDVTDEEIPLLSKPITSPRCVESMNPKLRGGITLVSTMIIALFCGTAYSFSYYSAQIRQDLHINQAQTAIIASAGIIGLFFVVPAGICHDRLGAWKTSTAGGIMVAGGYLIMSLAIPSAWGVALVGFTIVSFGAGASFLCSLATAMKAIPGHPGAGASLCGACMSLSLALATQLLDAFQAATGCDQAYCWKHYVRFFAVLCGVVIAPASIVLILCPKSHKAPPKGGETADSDSAAKPPLHQKPVGLLQSLQGLKVPIFWTLFCGYFVAIGSGIFVVTFTEQIWAHFSDGRNVDRFKVIATGYSIVNALGGLLIGTSVDKIQNKKAVIIALMAIDAVLFSVMLGLNLVPGHEKSEPLGILFSAVVIATGFCWGGFFALFPLSINILYGSVNFGVFFGYLQISTTIASIVFPQIAAAMGQAFSNFLVMYLFVAAAFTFSIIFLLLSNMSVPYTVTTELASVTDDEEERDKSKP